MVGAILFEQKVPHRRIDVVPELAQRRPLLVEQCTSVGTDCQKPQENRLSGRSTLDVQPGAVRAQPGAARLVLGMMGADQRPESGGVIALFEVRKLMHDDVLQHLARGHDEVVAETQ